MAKDFVHIICILDRSGSMGSLADEVIGAFNEFVDDQLKQPGRAKLTLVLFDDKYEVVFDKIKLKDVPDLTREVYFTRGMTGLYDAVGKTLASIDDPDAIVLIQTDGYENSSREYTQAQVKELIKAKEALGWEFQFLGADIDTVSVGSSMGLSAKSAVSFDKSSFGIHEAYASMNSVSTSYRSMKADEFALKNSLGTSDD